jgi:hypothetical protein
MIFGKKRHYLGSKEGFVKPSRVPVPPLNAYGKFISATPPERLRSIYLCKRLLRKHRSHSEALTAIATSLAEAHEYHWLLRLIQQAWLRATTRDEMIHLLGMATPFIPHHPDIGPAFVEGFAWVDGFLRG